MLKKLRESGAKLREIPPERRIAALREEGLIDWDDVQDLTEVTLGDWVDELDRYAENVFAAFPMPWGIAEHFRVNGRDIPAVPMVTEERTVIAAASKAAKLCGPDGFRVEVGPPLARAQVLLRMDYDDEAWWRYEGESFKDLDREIVAEISEKEPVFRRHGGGLIRLEPDYWEFPAPEQGNYFSFAEPPTTRYVEFTLVVNTSEAMGASGVARLARAVGRLLNKKFGWEPLSWICLNDNPQRNVKATAFWREEDIGEDVIEQVLLNQQWAEFSGDRAKTHNKGIMNGVIAVAQATGQDTRAIEAGFWADAYREMGVGPLNGPPHFREHCPRPLTTYQRTTPGHLSGTFTAQLTVGTVGGATDHPCAALSRKMMGVENSADLMAVMGAVGLAQNFAALAWALNT